MENYDNLILKLLGVSTPKEAFEKIDDLITKNNKYKNALLDIKNWDDEIEDMWEDTGYRAEAALINKLDT